MIKLYVKDINNYNYYLVDEQENNYILNIELYNTIEKIKISDIIYIDSRLLKENIPLSFKFIDNIESVTNLKEILLLKKNKKILYFKRVYG